jgi:hypothetical protein
MKHGKGKIELDKEHFELGWKYFRISIVIVKWRKLTQKFYGFYIFKLGFYFTTHGKWS